MPWICPWWGRLVSTLKWALLFRYWSRLNLAFGRIFGSAGLIRLDIRHPAGYCRFIRQHPGRYAGLSGRISDRSCPTLLKMFFILFLIFHKFSEWYCIQRKHGSILNFNWISKLVYNQGTNEWFDMTKQNVIVNMYTPNIFMYIHM